MGRKNKTRLKFSLKQNEEESTEYELFLGGKKKIFYQGLKENKLISMIDIFSEQILVEENIPQLKWKIDNEKKMLDNYLLKKPL